MSSTLKKFQTKFDSAEIETVFSADMNQAQKDVTHGEAMQKQGRVQAIAPDELDTMSAVAAEFAKAADALRQAVSYAN